MCQILAFKTGLGVENIKDDLLTFNCTILKIVLCEKEQLVLVTCKEQKFCNTTVILWH